jgi:hypothetical protein
MLACRINEIALAWSFAVRRHSRRCSDGFTIGQTRLLLEAQLVCREFARLLELLDGCRAVYYRGIPR